MNMRNSTGEGAIQGGNSSVSLSSSRPEPFVDAQVVADYPAVRRPDVLKLTRERKIRGYAYRGQQRHVYRYRLSEVIQDFEELGRAKMASAVPVSQRRKSSNG